jgi:hypothetical protein
MTPRSATRLLTLLALVALAGPAFAQEPTTVEIESAYLAEPASEELAAPVLDPNPGGFGLSETAFMSPGGIINWTSSDIAYHRFDFAVSDHVSLSVSATLPVGLFAAAGHARFGGEVAEDLHLAFTVEAGMAWFIFAPDALVTGFGGGPTLTWGTPDLYLNVKARAWGLSTTATDELAWFALPTIGGGVRVADFARLYLDAGPILTSLNPDHGTVWAIHYGVRFHGQTFYGDIGFLIPAFDGWEEMARYSPLGLPAMSLGAAF